MTNSNHNLTNKVITCHICDKTVKDYRLSSHLLFGSLQCRDCDLKFRHCKDFDSFRKSKDERKRSDSCAHRKLRWTRDPAEYLERKLRKELAKSTSRDHHLSTKKVTKGMISYLSKLKPIECKSPWRYAIEKLEKYVSSKHEGRKYPHGSHRHEKEKYAGTENGNHREKKGGSKSKEKEENPYYKGNTTEKVLYSNAVKEANHETTNITDDIDMCSSDPQNGDEIINEEGMIPQCVEEVVIPQADWEIDIGSLNEFEECNKSVAISLGMGVGDDIPFILEEVCITKHEEAGVITLIIEDVECTSESTLNTTAKCEDTGMLSADISENCIEPVVEFCENKIQLKVDKADPEELIYGKNTERDEINEARAVSGEEIFEDKVDKLKPEEDSCGNKIQCREDIHENKLATLAAVCESKMKLESERTFEKEVSIENEGSTSSENETPASEDEDRVECNGRGKKRTKQRTRTNKECSKPKCQKRRCYSMRNALHRKIQENMHNREENWKPQRHHRISRGNDFKTTKYNLRSRSKQISNSFLQKLDAYEKKKLWEKLVPTARKLRGLRTKGNGESSSVPYLPIDSDEYDDDFLVDVLLSQTLDIQQLNEIRYLSSADNNDEITFLMNQVKKVIKQFSFSIDRPCSFSATVESSKSLTSRCVKNVSMKRRKLMATETKERKNQDRRHLDRMIFGKDTPKKQLKTFYVIPPSDGKYYVVTYPSQPFLTECPMCYFRVFPAMFSLNLVTNLATTKCVGCMLTIYVVQEPDDNNSLPKIVFRREPSEDNPKVPKPARYKLNNTKLQKRVSARNFFKN